MVYENAPWPDCWFFNSENTLLFPNPSFLPTWVVDQCIIPTADFRHSLSRNRSKIATAPRRWHKVRAQRKIPVVFNFPHHRYKVSCTSYVKGLEQFALCSRLAYLPAAVPCTTNLVFHYNPEICLFSWISQSNWTAHFSREIRHFSGRGG